MVNSSRWKSALVVPLVLSIGLLGCSSSDDDEQGSGDGSDEPTTSAEASSLNADGVQRQPEGQASFFEIEEVRFGDEEAVVLRNVTGIEASTDRLHLCHGDECSALPDTVVPAGEQVVVTSADPGEADGVVVGGVDLGGLEPVDGEVAVYVSDPDDPELMINYLEWGSTPHSRAGDAIDRGLWLEGSFAPSGETATRLYKDADSGLWLWESG